MKNHTRKRTYRWVTLFLVLPGLLVGCSFLSTPKSPLPNTSPTQESHPTPENKALPSSSDSSESNASETTANFLDCPSPGETLFLGFDHTLTMNQEGASLTHILHTGLLTLNVQTSTGQGESTVSSSAPLSIPYEMQGVMGDCSLEMEGVMQASASGYCEDGTVYLTIVEDWQPALGQMVCPDETVPFQVPAAGSMIHEGADGNGEVFYLLDGSEGYTSMRPFEEGEGYHTWTLYTTQIEIVPLVPENQ